ncbi:MAG: hypothetical protein ACOVKS_06680 [Aquimonas sp.]
MNDTTAHEARQALQRLARDYLVQLRAELSAAQTLAAQSCDAMRTLALIRTTHRVTGSSLSFGQVDLGKQPQSLEPVLRHARTARR